jgi:hypothetical protein
MFVPHEVAVFWIRRLDKPWAAALVLGVTGVLVGAFAGAKQAGIEGFFGGAFVAGVIGTVVGFLFGVALWAIAWLIGLDKPVRDPRKFAFPLSCTSCDFRVDESGPWTRRDFLATPTKCPKCASPLIVRPAVCPRCGDAAADNTTPDELNVLAIRARTCPFCGTLHDRWGHPL